MRSNGAVSPNQTSPAGNPRRVEGLVGLIVVLSTLGRLGLAAWAPPLGDETNFLVIPAAWGYVDTGPMVFWLAKLGPAWLGSEASLWFRLPFVLLFSLSLWLMYRLTADLYGPRAGLWSVILLNLSFFFVLGAGCLATPEAPLVFCWLACAQCLARVLREPAPVRPNLLWVTAGVWWGLALLSKFQAFLLPVGVLAFLLLSRTHRIWLKRPGPYLALVAAALVFAPNLIWNWQHQWIAFTYSGARGLGYRGFFPWRLLMNLGGQASFLSPWLWGGLVASLAWGVGGRRVDWAGRWLGLSALAPLAFFSLPALFSREWYQVHWPLPAYVLLFPILGRWTATAWAVKRVWVRTWLGASALTGLAVLVGMASYVQGGWARSTALALMPDRHPRLHWDLTTFPDLDRQLLAMLPPAAAGAFWLTENRMDAGRLWWAGRRREPVLCWGEDPINFAFLPQAGGKPGQDGLGFSRLEQRPKDLLRWKPFFAEHQVLGRLEGRWGDQPGSVLEVIWFKNLQRPFPMPYGPLASGRHAEDP